MVKKKFNIISAVFNEADNLEAFFTKIKEVKTNLEKDYDVTLVLVDDGSKDKSQKILDIKALFLLGYQILKQIYI